MIPHDAALVGSDVELESIGSTISRRIRKHQCERCPAQVESRREAPLGNAVADFAIPVGFILPGTLELNSIVPAFDLRVNDPAIVTIFEVNVVAVADDFAVTRTVRCTIDVEPPIHTF